MNTNKVRYDAVHGALLGVCIGDALGMPVETLSHERILELTNGEGIQDFVAPMQFRVKDTAGLPPGSTTDDWQLTEVVVRSILECRRFDMRHCAQEHVSELSRSVFGWGKTTVRSIEAIRDDRRDLSLPPQSFGDGTGCGNGVIMKVAPLAAFHAFRWYGESEEALCRDTLALGHITHPDIRASISAYAVASLLAAIFRGEVTDTTSGKSALQEIIQKLPPLERSWSIPASLERVSDRLEILFQEGVLVSEASLRLSVKCGFMALDTAAFAIGVFLRHPDDFRAAVLEAVNAGGDTDTNASIVGALVGANVGARGIPEQWSSFNPDFSEAERLARAFCELAESRS
jgi:ADP-ribosylglycohydrolase